MFREPEHDLDAGPVPAVSEMVREEAPCMVVLFREKNAYAVAIDGAGVVAVPPDDAEEERFGRRHNSGVWQWPATVVVRQRADRLQKEGMAGSSAHSVVGDTGGDGAADPRRAGEERIEAAIASLGCVSSVSVSYRAWYIHRPDQCRFCRNDAARGIEWHRCAEWDKGSRQRSQETMGIWACQPACSKPWACWYIFGSNKLSRLLINP